MATYVLLNSYTVGSSGASSVTFSSIPSTYTDLKVVLSTRGNNTGVRVRFNSDSGTNYSWLRLSGSGSAVTSDNASTYGSPYNSFVYFSYQDQSSDTTNTFGNGELYLPNYAGSNYKSVSVDSVDENNATAGYQGLSAGLWSSTSAVNAITFSPDTSSSPSFVQYSTFYLYGIKNS